MGIIHNDHTWHVIFSLEHDNKDCMVTITIPDVPTDHRVTVGEAILNLDHLFEEHDSLECLNEDGRKIDIPLDANTPKSSQIAMLSTSIVVMTDGEYREFLSTNWERELQAEGIYNKGNNTVN